MPLTPRQDLMLHLGGTVRLPSPPPATASILTVAPPAGVEVRPADVVLRIVHQVNPLQTIERIVRMVHVRTILAPWPAMKADAPKERGFRTFEQFSVAAAEFAAAHRSADAVWLEQAVAFVDEAAPVVLVSETAQTAAESADYYPPLPGAGRGSKPLQLTDCQDHQHAVMRQILDCNDLMKSRVPLCE